jgi:hypothetical protein
MGVYYVIPPSPEGMIQIIKGLRRNQRPREKAAFQADDRDPVPIPWVLNCGWISCNDMDIVATVLEVPRQRVDGIFNAPDPGIVPVADEGDFVFLHGA